MAAHLCRPSELCAAVLVMALALSSRPSGPDALARSRQDGHTWRVTVTLDAPDIDLGDGVCTVKGGGCSLRAAIQEGNVAPDADTVLVPAGEYAIGIADLGALEPEDGAADELQGDLDVRNPLTIVGDGRDQVVFTGKGDYTFVQVHPAATLTLRGVSVRDSGSIAVTSAGGACLHNLGHLTVEGSAFRGCVQSAIRTEGPLRVTNAYFAGNSAIVGGAITTFYARAPVTVERSQFVRNSAAGGGAIASDFGAIRISDSSFEANSATGGGAISVSNAPLVVERSTFLANEATSAAAILFDGQRTGSTVTIDASAFEMNRSKAIASWGLVLAGGSTIRNTTVDALDSDLNASIMTIGDARLDHVTLSGGGLVVDRGTAELHSSLLSGARCTGILVSRGHNVVAADRCPLVSQPTDRLNVKAPLLAMAENGGPTRSRLPDLAAGAHPAVDGADPSGCPETDQRGFARPAGAGCDVGAVEVGAAPPAQTATPTAVPTAQPFVTATRSWVLPTLTPFAAGQLPTRLEPVAQIGGALEDAVLWEDGGAVLTGPELKVVDLTDPDAPHVTGRLSFDHMGVALVGPTEDGTVLALLDDAPPEVVEVKVLRVTHPTILRRWRLPDPPPPTLPVSPAWPVTRSADLTLIGQRAYAAWITPYGDDQYLIVHVLDLDAPNPAWTLVAHRKGEFTAVVDLAVTPTRAFLVYRPRTTWNEFTLDSIWVIGFAGASEGEVSSDAVAPLVAIVARDETAYAIGRRVGGSPPPGGYARPNRVLTIDATDASRPHLAATTALTQTTPLQGAALNGARLWLVTGADVVQPGGGDLVALDVSAPVAPRPVGPPIALRTYGRIVAAAGNNVVVGDAGAWLRVVTTDGTSARPRGELAGLGPVFEVASAGDRLYAAGEAGAASLSVVNVDDPRAPRLISAWGRDHRRGGSRHPIGVAAAGETVWVADGLGAHAVDVTDATAPRTTGHWLEGAVDVAVDGGTAWLLGYARGTSGTMELHAVAADDRAAAVRGPFAPREGLMSIAVGDDHMLYAATLNGTVVGLAPTGQDPPRFLAALDPSQFPRGASGPQTFSRPCCYGHVAVSRGLGLAAFSGATFFGTGPAGPEQVLSSMAFPSLQVEGATLQDGRAVLAAGSDGVGVVDAHDPEQPTLAAWADTPGHAHRIAVDGPWLYVADGPGGLHVYRMVLDAAPRLTPQLWLPWAGGRP